MATILKHSIIYYQQTLYKNNNSTGLFALLNILILIHLSLRITLYENHL